MADEQTSSYTSPYGVSVEDILYKDGNKKIEDELDSVLSISPSGALSTAIGDNFYGINHRQQPGSIPINRDMHGLTFFTRPRLNLTNDNIRTVRQLTPLLTKESMSIQRIIRCLLDPELARSGSISSPFVDSQQAFIPMLTNNLLSMSGWPDLEARMFTSHEGVYGEAFSMVDSVVQNYSTYDITANFRNIPGDPITLMFLIWLHYMSQVYLGNIVPYPDALIQNEIDYNTRIYRLVLDATKTKVQKIAACGASLPWSCPIGAAFNFESDRPLNQSNDQLTIQFRCMGAQYQDDILIDEFNRTTALFNDTMSASYFKTLPKRVGGYVYSETTNPYYVRVTMEELEIFNNRGYPRIDPETYTLEWWVSKQEYANRLPLLTQKRAAEGNF